MIHKKTKNPSKIYLIDFILKEWLSVGSGICLALSIFWLKHFPNYSSKEFEILFILLVLFICVNGLYKNGLMAVIAQKIENEKFLALKLIIFTFLLSMFVTNDIALIIIVPLTLSFKINQKNILVILETLSANAGSGLTPFGNPQNLFIYWHYNISLLSFIKTIAPFSLFFLILLLIASLFIKTSKTSSSIKSKTDIPKQLNRKVFIYSAFFFMTLLMIFHILPIQIGIFIVLFALIEDRKSLKIDYFLLLTFFFFFGLAENLQFILKQNPFQLKNVFLSSALLSQLIGNVSTAVLLSKFTANWQSLLWGVNAGGFGSLFASFANLIAYKIYISQEESKNIPAFTLQFILIGYAAFALSIAFFYR